MDRCMYVYMRSMVISQWLLYKSVVLAAMDFTRTHKSIVGAVVDAVDITRTHVCVVVVVGVVVVATVEIYHGV